jgi:hypothetical protein
MNLGYLDKYWIIIKPRCERVEVSYIMNDVHYYLRDF